jgi:hypothetical protein
MFFGLQQISSSGEARQGNPLKTFKNGDIVWIQMGIDSGNTCAKMFPTVPLWC